MELHHTSQKENLTKLFFYRLLGCVQRFYGHLIWEEQLAVSPVRAQHYLHEPEPLPRALGDEQVSVDRNLRSRRLGR